jgi:hypothetical protein
MDQDSITLLGKQVLANQGKKLTSLVDCLYILQPIIENQLPQFKLNPLDKDNEFHLKCRQECMKEDNRILRRCKSCELRLCCYINEYNHINQAINNLLSNILFTMYKQALDVIDLVKITMDLDDEYILTCRMIVTYKS